MSRIIQLPLPTTEYPDTTDALDLAERAFLLAVRRWVATSQQNGDPLFHLRAALGSVGAESGSMPARSVHDACGSFDLPTGRYILSLYSSFGSGREATAAFGKSCPER
jgi:hypothetical protein